LYNVFVLYNTELPNKSGELRPVDAMLPYYVIES